MICKYCGKEFTKTACNKNYCSPECKAAGQRKHKDEINAQNRAIYKTKHSWLTIPDAPNYEISPDLQVRNKKTGKLLKQFFQQGMTTPAVSLYYNGKARNVYLKSARCKAEAAVLDEIGEEWYPVPSLDNRYEFSSKYRLRNSKSKRLVSQRPDGKRYVVRRSGNNVTVSVVSLRWEIFGENPPKNIAGINKPLIIKKGLTTLYFDSRRGAAKFIANENFFTPSYIAHKLSKRQPEICGWTINYIENDTNVGEYLKGMQKKDPRQAKTK